MSENHTAYVQGARNRGRHRNLGRKRVKRWRKIAPWVLLFVLFALLFRWLGGYHPAPAVYATPATAQPLVHLPKDDAPHESYMEWWYYNGHLHSADDRTYTFHYVFFVVSSVVNSTAAHVALTDNANGKRWTFQRQSPGHPSYGTRDGFNLALTDWLMSGSGGNDLLKVKNRDFGFELRLETAMPPVFHGGTGLLDFKQAGSSYYYSRPRMRIAGHLAMKGKPVPVTGEAWFDHQWGDFHPTQLGWNWFALQLNDGTDIMLYQLSDVRRKPLLLTGSYTRDGRTETLKESDLLLSASRSWTSAVTHITYPIGWQLQIPRFKIDVQLTPNFPNAEVDARESTHTVYWEGGISVAGSHSGRGFLEVNPVLPTEP